MSSSGDLVWSAGWQLRDRIAEGTLSSVELVEASLERIEALEPTLHAFITVAGAQAREEARRADAAVAAGEPLGALHGLPVALKDEAWTAGIRSTGGSLLFDDFVPAADGAVAARLRAAGAVIVGKTNMPEFAMWPRSQSRVGGESMNPWDTTRISGASSGGSAAALAAGLVPLAIGSDGGGSIRIPASLSGVVGLFPTPGRVSARGSFSYSPYASLGPMARDVRDVATVLQTVAGYDPDDPFSVDRPVPDYLASLDGGTNGLHRLCRRLRLHPRPGGDRPARPRRRRPARRARCDGGRARPPPRRGDRDVLHGQSRLRRVRLGTDAVRLHARVRRAAPPARQRGATLRLHAARHPPRAADDP